MKVFCKLSHKIALGILLSFLTSSVFAAGQHCKVHYIQLFATASAAKADDMKRTFSSAGFNAAITPFTRNGTTLYRIRTGPYDTQALALAAQQKMKGQLSSNTAAKNSIIATGTKPCGNKQPPAKPTTTFLKNTTQCYRNNDPSIVIAIQLTEQNGNINGYYFSRPTGIDGGYGFITGTRVNNTITAKLSYSVEGDTGVQNVSYDLQKQALIDDSERYPQVNCNTVKDEIDVAKNVSKALKEEAKQPTSSDNRTKLRFSQFEVATTYTGENQPLVMDEFSRTFRTRLRRAIKNQKPSFAGHYLVTGWGCGSGGCNTGAVINAKTGVATPFPVALASVYPLKTQFAEESGQEHIYQLNSRLMIFAGDLGGSQNDGSDSVEFYEFKDGKFTFLESRPYGRAAAD